MQGAQGPEGAAGGGGGWTDDGTVVRLTTSTDNVTIGSAVAGGKLFIDGDADEIQLQVQAVGGGQTAAIISIEGALLTPIMEARTGGFFPATDALGGITIGSSAFRWASMASNAFDVFGTVSDANPIVSMNRAAGGFGLITFGAGGGSGVDTGLRRSAAGFLAATEGSGTIDAGFHPITDSQGSFGNSTFRYLSMTANTFNIFGTVADTFPRVQLALLGGGGGAVLLGAGGASAVDVSLLRVAASQLSVADSSGTITGQFVPLADLGGSIGTALLRWGSMFISGTASVGADVVTTATTFNIGNTVATTVNIAGAASTATNIGNVSGPTTIAGRLFTTSNGTIAGLRVGSTGGDPSTLADGDVWYNSAANKFRVRENGASVDMIGSGWTDDGAVVRLTTSTDNVTIGPATAGGQRFIDGDTDEIQLQVQSHSTQTADILVIENSAGTDLFRFTPANTLVPGTDDTGSIGTASLRWNLVRATTITSGDLNLEDPSMGTAWTIREAKVAGEDRDSLYAINRVNGKKYKLKLEEVAA